MLSYITSPQGKWLVALFCVLAAYLLYCLFPPTPPSGPTPLAQT